jgi:F-type H+-transporting ATPase subunit b
MTFNVWTFLFEVLNFLVLAYLLHRLLYRPLHEAIDARRAATTRAQADAEKVRQDALALQERLRKEETEQEQRLHELIRNGREQGEADRRRLLDETEKAVRSRQDEVRQALAREREEALNALRGEVIRQAVDAAGRLLQQASNSTLERQLAARLAESLQTMPPDERTRLRDQWASGDGALLETTTSMEAAELAQIRTAVADLLGAPTDLTVEVRPELLGGTRLRLGGQVWDASVAGQLGTLGRDGAKEAERV